MCIHVSQYVLTAVRFHNYLLGLAGGGVLQMSNETVVKEKSETITNSKVKLNARYTVRHCTVYMGKSRNCSDLYLLKTSLRLTIREENHKIEVSNIIKLE